MGNVGEALAACPRSGGAAAPEIDLPVPVSVILLMPSPSMLMPSPVT